MTAMDFADYRLRMRAGHPAAQRSFYLVGLTSGVRSGVRDADRDLRMRLADTIRAHDRNAVVHDPVEAWYADGAAQDGPAGRAEFHRLTALAAGSEVCVAWLPDRERIADSVAEVQAASRGGSTVVVITGATDEFLVRTFASVVLPDLDAFANWLQLT